MRHHAFVIEAGAEEGIGTAKAWAKRELAMEIQGNPDVVVLQYGLLSVEDARAVFDLATGKPFRGEYKVVIVSASRAYREAQNALLKLFEEPPEGTYLFLVLPSLGSLLPTLRSRVQVLTPKYGLTMSIIPETAKEFLEAGKERRSAIIKRIAAHREGDAVSAREEALAVVNGIETAAYAALHDDGHRISIITPLLSDIATLRGHLHDRSAPVRMILEHLSLVIPKDLV
jgi:DNA polymerase III delta prime subunit